MPGKNKRHQICAQRSCVDVPVPATQRSEGYNNTERHRFLAEYVRNRTIATDFACPTGSEIATETRFLLASIDG